MLTGPMASSRCLRARDSSSSVCRASPSMRAIVASSRRVMASMPRSLRQVASMCSMSEASLAARAVRAGALLAQGFGLVTQGAQTLVELGHGGAQLCGFGGEARAFGNGGGAEFGELGVLGGEGCGLLFAAEFFRCSRRRVAGRAAGCAGSGRCRGGWSARSWRRHCGGALRGRRARRRLRGGLLELFAAAAKLVELLLQLGEVGFERWRARSRRPRPPAGAGR